MAIPIEALRYRFPHLSNLVLDQSRLEFMNSYQM